MRFLARDESTNGDNPVLQAWVQSEGRLVDAYSLEFIIWDLQDPSSPVQVYPPTGRATVDVANDWPTGDRLGTGRYAARYTVNSGEALGLHEIEWFLVRESGDAEETWVQPFDVIEKPYHLTRPVYALISDVRAEGLDSSSADDRRVMLSLINASMLIEQFTARRFGPRAFTMRVDGNAAPELLLDEPIIGIGEILIRSEFSDTFSESLADVVVYNRHLEGLFDPDDRNAPRIAFKHDPDFRGHRSRHHHRIVQLLRWWPRGNANIELDGVFGYTDPDGSPYGDVPLLLRRACVLMVNRVVSPALTAAASAAMQVAAGPIVEERTRDQVVKYADNSKAGGSASFGPFTGDPEIDNILLSYCRPAFIGAV